MRLGIHGKTIRPLDAHGDAARGIQRRIAGSDIPLDQIQAFEVERGQLVENAPCDLALRPLHAGDGAVAHLRPAREAEAVIAKPSRGDEPNTRATHPHLGKVDI